MTCRGKGLEHTLFGFKYLINEIFYILWPIQAFNLSHIQDSSPFRIYFMSFISGFIMQERKMCYVKLHIN